MTFVPVPLAWDTLADHTRTRRFGEEDPNPSPAHAARLQGELDKHGKTYELWMYRHAGHAFFADYQPNYRAAAAQDMWHRVLVFYEKYLKA
jgi:carboxymethylenebutenolidase